MKLIFFFGELETWKYDRPTFQTPVLKLHRLNLHPLLRLTQALVCALAHPHFLFVVVATVAFLAASEFRSSAKYFL